MQVQSILAYLVRGGEGSGEEEYEMTEVMEKRGDDRGCRREGECRSIGLASDVIARGSRHGQWQTCAVRGGRRVQ